MDKKENEPYQYKIEMYSKLPYFYCGLKRASMAYANTEVM